MFAFLVRVDANPNIIQIQSRRGKCARAPPSNFKRRRTSEATQQHAGCGQLRLQQQQCFAESELHHPPHHRGEGQHATLCSLARAQRIQAGMKVFLGDLQCSAPILPERHTLRCAARNGLIDHRNKNQQFDPPLMVYDGCFVLHPQKPFYLRAATMLTVWKSRGAAEPIRMS